MVLSELTNKELKSILRENDVRNYSKLNKKNLVKKVNQLIKVQNDGGKKSEKGENKKYTLRELIGGTPGLGPNGKPLTEVTVANATVANATVANTTIAKPVAPPGANATGAPLKANITIATPSPTVNPANGQIPASLQRGTNTSLASAPELNNNNKITESKSLPPARSNNALYVYGTEIPVTTNSNKAITKQRPYMKTPNNNSNNNTKANKPKDDCGPCSIL